MARAKARYKGDIPTRMVRTFPEDIREKLRKCFTEDDLHCPYFGQPSDEFINILQDHTQWAEGCLNDMIEENNNADLRAEYDDLMTTLEGTRDKLKNISTGLWEFLEYHPLSYADRINSIISDLEKNKSSVEKLPTSFRKEQKNKVVANELAIRVLRDVKVYGVLPHVTHSADDAYDTKDCYMSGAVKIIEILHKFLGLPFSPATLKRVVSEAKQAANI